MALKQAVVAGLDYLELAADLLHRARHTHPVGGIWEAADLQWWWRKPRRSDRVGQLFWLDEHGPVAAAIVTDWDDHWSCDPVVVSESEVELRTRGWRAALALLRKMEVGRVKILVRDDDAALRRLVVDAGFRPSGEQDTTTWMSAEERPGVPPLPDGYRLSDRTEPADGQHHLALRSGPHVEERLRQAPMYDPSLDLAVRASDGAVAAYGLFWFDPVTKVGLVEPMRTEDRHQRRGLARVVLREGLDRLSRRGARRLKVSYERTAAGALYLGSGFKPTSTTTYFARDLRAAVSRDVATARDL